jgi:site-specific recombinase XerD
MKQSWDKEYIKVEKRSTTGKWHVEGVLPYRDKNGKRERVRKRFDTKDQAYQFAEQQRDKGINYLRKGTERHTRLNEQQEADALSALKILEAKFPDDIRTLTDAVFFYCDQFQNINKNFPLGEAIKKYLSNPKFVKCSSEHQRQFRRRLNRFLKAHDENKSLDSFTSDYIEEWIYDELREVSDTERRNEYACIHAFLNWCVKKELVFKNVCSVVDKPNATAHKPQALTIPQVKSLMKWAKEIDCGSTVPFFALAIFGGFRPSEIARMDWSQFNWDENIIVVEGKGNRYRSVELPETCVAWIKEYAEEEGSVTPANLKNIWSLVRALAGFRITRRQLYGVDKEGYDDICVKCEDKSRPKWVSDVMRHTAITYYQKQNQDIGKTASWAGNSVSIINTHYRAVEGVTGTTNKQFWNILPSKR